MTLETTNVKMPVITGTGSASTYNFTFTVAEKEHLKVVKVDLAGVSTTLVLNTDYSVTLSGTGGSITLLAGNLTTGHKLYISRVVPLTQGTSIRNQGPYYPELHEDQFDLLAMADQQQQEELDRAPKLAETSTASAPTLPDPQADRILGYNSSGVMENKSFSTVLSEIGAASAANLTAHTSNTSNPHSVTAAQVGSPTTADFTAHTGNTSNPHSVTAAQVGAPTTADFTAHTGNTSNPHSVTAAQVGAPTTAQFTAHTGNTSNPHSVTATQVGKDTAQWNADRIKGLAVDITGSADGRLLGFNSTTGGIEFMPAGAGGELITASNVGTAGVGLFKQRSVNDLQFRNINAGSNKITLTLDAANNEVDIDVAESNFTTFVRNTGDEDIAGNKNFTNGIGVGISPATYGKIVLKQAANTYTNALVVQSSSDDSSLLSYYDGTRFVLETTYYTTGANKNFALRLNGADRLVADTSGNVGVGVTPSYKLHVGISAATTTLGSNTAAIASRDGTEGHTWVLGNNISGLAAKTSFGIADYSVSATPFLQLDSSGNVGIGGTPSAKLHLTGATTGETPLRITNNAHSVQLSQDSGGLAYLGTITNDPFALYINNAEQARLTTTGLGIGKTATQKLDVNGGVLIAGTATTINTTGLVLDYNSTSREARIAVGGTSGADGLLTITTSNGGVEAEVLRFKATRQVRFVPLSADPSGAEQGDVYYNSTDKALKVHNGTTWSNAVQMTAWTSYSPTLNSNTNVLVNTAWWRRVGDTIEIKGVLRYQGAGAAGTLTVSIPDPGTNSIDTAKLPGGTSGMNAGGFSVGTGVWHDAGVGYRHIAAAYNSTTTVAFAIDGAGVGVASSDMANGDYVNFNISVPISGWGATY